ncbi:MAG TPA: phosphate ABC transporter substrate-binding protein [Armatimonadota bacterium]|jgi:phosphate transport system substrate-binding protein
MKKNTFLMLAVVAVLAILVLKMTSSGGQKSPGTPQGAASATKDMVTVVGSDTMVHLVSAWAEGYMKVHPGAGITVTGGGSGPGIRALIDGTTAICAASRPMDAKETADATKAGFTPKEYHVALDGISVIVNPGNALNEVTMEQLKKIFTGASNDWKQIGTGSGPIEVISRESSSGTYKFFQEHVMKKEDYAASAKMMPATASIIQTVGQDAGAIGYVGLGYAAGAKGSIKVLRVKKDAKSPAVTPSEATVKDGSYPVARPLFLYTRGEASGAAKAFIDYCLSPAGQQIVKDTGYVTVAK